VIYDRPYQTEAVQSIWHFFEHNNGNPVLALPTGTGKSIVIARFLQSVYALYPNQRVLMLTHVKELIQQNHNKLMAVWPQAPCGIFSAGLGQKDYRRPITFAGVASIAKKASLFGHIDLVIIDEAHLVSPSETTMYRKFLAELLKINPYLKIIGLTATPWRLGHGRLVDPVVNRDGTEAPSIFTDFCFNITGLEAFNRLIAEGYLAPLIPKRTKTQLSIDGVHMRAGEFIDSELQTAVDKEEITYAALKEAMELGHDRRKWLIFAAGTEHADHIGEMLNSLGVPTGVVHSKREDRDETIESFKRGELRAVVNCNVLTTGFDDHEIDMIICLRPTASTVLWVQMLGRGTRPLFIKGYDLNTIEGRLASIKASLKQNCLVLDYAGNTRRLGPINDPLIPRRKGEKGGEAPVKCCEVCNTWNHASVRFCCYCGHEFTFETKLKFTAATDELIKGDMPITEVFKVDHITINKHTKKDTPDMIRVSYYCGLNKFDEFVCPEHTNAGAGRALRWWRARTQNPMPRNTAEALELVDRLPHATHIRVWINKQYPEIMAHCFDGTAFGTQEMTDSVPEVSTTFKRANADIKFEDDIPF
jgi:DNA repair protein RadD